jgi:hypothetical protein
MRLAALLLASLVALPALAEDATRTIDDKLPPTLVKHPGNPYADKAAADGTSDRIRLGKPTATKNAITDNDEWFHRNVLPRPPEPLDEEWRNVPADTRWGKLKFFRSAESHHVAVYELSTPRKGAADEKGFSSIYNQEFNYTAVLFNADFAPQKLLLLEEFHPGILEMSNAHLVGDILYFDCNYNGYASIARKKTGYLVALDVKAGKVLWTTQALRANYPGFLVYKEVVISGYGFTEEPDFLYLFNRYTGKQLQEVKLRTAHDFLIPKDGKLYVRTYDHDYLFPIEEKPRR